MTTYFDCNATTPVDPRVIEVIHEAMSTLIGNAGSPHAMGQRAKRAVNQAREQISNVVTARKHEVVFTSGATESNNLAILGLAEDAKRRGKLHLVSSQIEHKSVLEPLARLSRDGFQVTLVPPGPSGRVEAQDILNAIQPDTALVSLMHANNETGVIQPIEEVAEGLQDGEIYLHVDAAQGFGKEIEALQHRRIDLISISGHKVYAPQGIGALITRRRDSQLPPLQPLQEGGGQEFGFRSGTVSVPLALGLGKAAELALVESEQRQTRCLAIRQQLLAALAPLSPTIHGDASHTQAHVVNLSFAGIDSELAIEALDDVIAVSNGSACTTICDTTSHVLQAMQVDVNAREEALRLSWYHDSQLPDLDKVVTILQALRAA